MFVSFTKTLKKMSGFRLGFGVRVNKRNAPLWCFAMLFAGMFYLMWYMIIGAGWCLYFFLWAFYKIYYYLFKGIAVGCKKLYQLIKGKTAAPSEASVEPPRRNEPNKKIPRARLESPHGGLFFMRRKAERGSAIRRTVNYSLLLSVSAGMPEMVK